MTSAKEVDCNLVLVGDPLTLENVGPDPWYRSLVVLPPDKLMAVDFWADTIYLYSCHDGKLLASSNKLQSMPCDICVLDIREPKVAVTLMNGHIEIMSVKSTGHSIEIKQSLNVKTEFDNCRGVRALRSRTQLVVSGRKWYEDTQEYWICWGIVSHVDRCVGAVHKCCKSIGCGSSYLATSHDDSMVYISCNAGSDSCDNGVYAFHITDGKSKFVYKNHSLTNPEGISVDKDGSIYICNKMHPPCIHRIMMTGKPMNVLNQGIPEQPWAIFWEENLGQMYITSWGNNKVWRVNPQCSDKLDCSVKLLDQESSCTSEEQPSNEEVKLWAKENHIDSCVIDKLLTMGFTSIMALKLLEPKDLKTTGIPLGQQRLIIACIEQLKEKDTAQVHSIQLKPHDIYSVQNNQNGKESNTTTPRPTLTISIASTCLQPLIALSTEIKNPDSQAIANTIMAHQMFDSASTSVDHTSASNAPGLTYVRYLQSGHDSGMETHSWKYHQRGQQSAVVGGHKAPEHLVSDENEEPVIKETSTETEQRVVTEVQSSLQTDAPTYSEDDKQDGHEAPVIERKQPVIKKMPTWTECQMIDPVEPVSSQTSCSAEPEQLQVSLQRRALPPGKMYHAFFSYTFSDIQWVKETVERLENDHGFVCCEYDRDNTPGTPLLKFADDGIRNAYKTIIVMTRKAFKSGFVLHEIQMAIDRGFKESKICIVPILLDDCEVPSYLRVLNYIDARDSKMRDLWWPKLLMELDTQDHLSFSSTSDTDRFMCIAYLLVDVGSQVLRQLFRHHTVNPNCTLDQYLLSNRKYIDKLHNKVLNQSQMDMLFPPSGGNTNLESYDITLLSALFTNIVHTLSQQEKNMIESLRGHRNYIYGHASSCRMNIHDYQTCWNSVSSTLIALSKHCGNPDFEQQIQVEIERIKVASIPVGSSLDILKTWFMRIETVEDELQDVKSRLNLLESKETPPNTILPIDMIDVPPVHPNDNI